ncbi:glycosyltransferase family 4 protein [Flavobacterium agricola]|uniref:Glycosyltransferase family 4 protein n=1 Tax=Flavobacterium agricola TaxID=2870839 RepID=A0ABY6M273_9FLAO|nr:glycosyltransferase family 4 protein [Flavobacterium agricola]UYW01495.1 glycosyltransferase family 4 protein [Flavobacterium agricola]
MNPTLLILSSVWVEPNSSAAGMRMLQLINLFQNQKYTIHYASTAANSLFGFNLQTLNVITHTVELNHANFDAFVKQLNPDVVIFDRFMVEEQFGWRVLQQCPNALRILDTEDLHCLRQARQLAYKQNRDFTETDLFSEHAKREIASILRCDLALIISTFEMQLLQNQFQIPENHLFYLPFLTDLNDWNSAVNKTFNQRADLVCIGNFLHEPNWATVQIIKENIWPILRKQLPEVNMRIYGAYPSQKVMQLHKPAERFFIEGRADNASEVIGSAKVMVAPIPFGAGIKGKLYEAMLYGTPSVTTPIGAEAMYDNLPWNGQIADNEIDFCNAVVHLYQNENQWKQAQQNGYDLIKSKYDKDLFADLFSVKIESLKNNLTLHRNTNFMGQILNYHLYRSTEFMSRWIEEKNKKQNENSSS